MPTFWRVHLWQVVRLSRFRTYRNAGSGPLVLLSSALLPCVWCIDCKYASISRFKGVFSAVWGCCVGLCCLGALRGLCGFCVREWLGGFGACCVFASVFHLLRPCLCPFLCPLCCCCPLLVLSISLWLVFGFLSFGCCFLFPFGMCAKREGAKCFASSLVLLLYLLVQC